jgi:hypothetical protein
MPIDRDLERILSRVGSKVGYRYPGMTCGEKAA